MKDYIILADSCSALSPELRAKYNIEYLMNNAVYNGKEIKCDLDWKGMSPSEYYDLMRNGAKITSTQVPLETFDKAFRQYIAEGKEVLYLGTSSALSGSVNSATVLAKELMEEFPGSKIICVDCLRSIIGQGAICVKAAEMRAEGKSIDEVAAWVTANRLKFHQFGTVENLEYLRRAGRIKAMAAFFGNLFGVKPIIISDAIGQNYAIKKVKGRKGSFNEIINMMKDVVESPETQTLYLAHADCIEDAELLRDMILKEIPFKDACIVVIDPSVGASVGPGTVSAYCFGKEVTFIGE